MTKAEMILDSINELGASRADLQFALSQAILMRHVGSAKGLEESIAWIDASIARLELDLAQEPVCRAEYLQDR